MTFFALKTEPPTSRSTFLIICLKWVSDVFGVEKRKNVKMSKKKKIHNNTIHTAETILSYVPRLLTSRALIWIPRENRTILHNIYMSYKFPFPLCTVVFVICFKKPSRTENLIHSFVFFHSVRPRETSQMKRTRRRAVGVRESPKLFLFFFFNAHLPSPLTLRQKWRAKTKKNKKTLYTLLR